MSDQRPFHLIARIARDYDRGPIRQQTTQRLVGFSSHDNVVTSGQGAKTLKVFRQMPRQGVIDAYDTVVGQRHDQRKRHAKPPPRLLWLDADRNSLK